MLKYSEYMNESNNIMGNRFNRGDKVIYEPATDKSYYKMHAGAECEVSFPYPLKGEYSIKTPSGAVISANESELRGIDEPKSQKAEPSYIENQFKPPIPHIRDIVNKDKEITVGTRVIVNGKEGKKEWVDSKGTVKRISPTTYFIDFDEDESKNQRSYSLLVKKEYVKPSGEPPVMVISVGDEVQCIDQQSQFFDRKGTVAKTWDDGGCMVDFKDNTGLMSMFLRPHQLKIIKYASVSNPIGFKIPDRTTSTPIPINPNSIVAEEEDDSTPAEPFKKADLLEFSYKDFFKVEKISTHEDLLSIKAKYEKILEDENVPAFKKKFIERSLRTAEIIESYYDFLINKIAKDLPVYRSVEQIDNDDILSTKTKVRASDSKELSRKYSFDQGIIAYWKFKDAVVFRTI